MNAPLRTAALSAASTAGGVGSPARSGRASLRWIGGVPAVWGRVGGG